MTEKHNCLLMIVQVEINKLRMEVNFNVKRYDKGNGGIIISRNK